MAAFPTRAEDIDRAWLQARLDAANVLDGAHVTDFTTTSIGTGQVGDTVRIALAYDRAAPKAPASIAAKLPSRDATSRSTAAHFRLYLREVNFYARVAPLVAMRVPKVYAALIDATGCDFILLFEDLGPAKVGDQLASCTLEQARLAVCQAASLHASTDNLPVLDEDWLLPDPAARDWIIQAYPGAQAVFRERYAGQIEPEHLAICEALAEAAPHWFSWQAGTRCLTHGDYRLDNMLFDIRGGAEPMAVVDWQTCVTGAGTTDLGYLLGTGIGTDLRRLHEDDLIDLYCSEMTRHGVPRDREAIWDDVRIGALSGLSTAVFSAAFVERTERGDANFLSMARGACSLALDHDSIGALLRHANHRAETTTC
ncbi:phosphotransferase [Blastomonas sp.]|uniref:phosphotransferase n=1 Tax=Blastomonas sp. TaxID=1909299 RepID=UPI00262E80FE|nr:phosphotransferase [Blastomonas sp.]MDM7955392.1 phosphotransferase [Blastomonas sp.]